MFSRFVSDYGIIFGLVALFVIFSVATLDEQHPTGAAAGEDLLAAIVRQTQAGATVMIAVRNTAEDAEFARALSEGLATAGRTVLTTLRGEPSQTRQALEE